MTVPSGFTWNDYVRLLVETEGGWAAIVDALYLRASGHVELPSDPGTIEKGIRRLSKKGHEAGGQYGRWLLRFFPLPAPLETWAKWSGQYHSRFSDLPLELRREQLRLMERPPISESKAVVWIHLGLASVAHRALDFEVMRSRLDMARRVQNAGVEAQIELALFEARVAAGDNRRATCDTLIDHADKLATELPEGSEATDIYRARIIDQRAYQLLHPEKGEPDFDSALELCRLIVSHGVGPHNPFISFRRHVNFAYIFWKLQRFDEASAACDRAISAAGDGGFVRLRVMALNLMSHIQGEDDEGTFHARAKQLALRLEDEELLSRVLKH